MPASPAAKRVRNALFDGLSQEEKDGRMHQVMQLLHTPEIEAYAVAYDPRITYLPLGTAVQPGSLVTVLENLRMTITEAELHTLFDGVPEFYDMWCCDKMLFDLAGILFALVHHTQTDRSR